MDWKNLSNTISKDEKLQFFEELLEKNEIVRAQFLSHFKRESKDDPSLTKASLFLFFEEQKSIILQELEALDFVNFEWEDYVPRHNGYIPEYEAELEIAEGMVKEVLDNPGEEIFSYIRSGNIAEGAMLFAAVYQACTEASYEEIYVFDDTEAEFLGLFQPIYEKMLLEIKSVIFSHDQNLLFIDALFTQYSGFGEDLKYFEPLLKSLVQNEKMASEVKELMSQYQIEAEYLPQFFLILHELMGNKDFWLDHARKYFKKDKELARKLMSFYLEEDRNIFLEIAEEVFITYPNTFDSDILENLDIKANREFYKTVLTRITSSSQNIEDYKKLKDLLSSEEKELLFTGIWNKVFLTEIFGVELLFERILQLVHSQQDSWDFPKIISPILEIYPKECFDIIAQKIHQSLEKERGRGSYQRVVSWIILLQKIPGFFENTRKIILTTYHQKPNLPALKDEMRKAGLG